MHAKDFVDLQHLLSGLCDGELSEWEFVRLEQMLQNDSVCRRRYLEYMDLHSGLRAAVRRGAIADNGSAMTAAVPVCSGKSAGPARPFSLRRPFRYAAFAAGVAAAVLLVQFLAPPPPPTTSPVAVEGPRKSRGNQTKPDLSVATLRQALNCAWDSPAKFQEVGARLPPGEYRLRQGVATIDFDSGSELIVEGPAVLHLESGAAAHVQSGKVVFRADDSAAPFVMHTPASTLTEVDTEYAVSVSAAAEEVHVFEGKVERTANVSANNAKPEELKAGEARRYEAAPADRSRPTPCDPKRFVRKVDAPAPTRRAKGLLAYEGFDYRSPSAFASGKANGGFGWSGPWKTAVTHLPWETNRPPRPTLNSKESLTRDNASAPGVGGCFEYAGFAKSWRRLAVPVRLDSDNVYFLSYLFRHGNPAPQPFDSTAILFWTDEDYQQKKNEDFWKRLNVGVQKSNAVYTRLQRMSANKSMPMDEGMTYLLVAKIVARREEADQIFVRVYRAGEPVESTEPTAWPLQSQPFRSDLVFDWLQLHVNSKARHTIDEIRLGATWPSVTAAWGPAS